jgi:hypothetical protein
MFLKSSAEVGAEHYVENREVAPDPRHQVLDRRTIPIGYSPPDDGAIAGLVDRHVDDLPVVAPLAHELRAHGIEEIHALGRRARGEDQLDLLVAQRGEPLHERFDPVEGEMAIVEDENGRAERAVPDTGEQAVDVMRGRRPQVEHAPRAPVERRGEVEGGHGLAGAGEPAEQNHTVLAEYLRELFRIVGTTDDPPLVTQIQIAIDALVGAAHQRPEEAEVPIPSSAAEQFRDLVAKQVADDARLIAQPHVERVAVPFRDPYSGLVGKPVLFGLPFGGVLDLGRRAKDERLGPPEVRACNEPVAPELV